MSADGGIRVIVDVFVNPIRTLSTTPVGLAAEAVAAIVIAAFLIEFAAVIWLTIEIIAAILVLAAVLALAYVLGKRRAGNGDGWRPVDTGYRVSTSPAVVEGRRCAPCGRIYRTAVAAIDGPAGRIYVCRDHATREQMHAITGGIR